MGEEFLEGYISVVDGEKDPRNLMLAFAIDRVLCIEFDISNHVEVSSKLPPLPETHDLMTRRICSTSSSVIFLSLSDRRRTTHTVLHLMTSDSHCSRPLNN